MQGSKIISNKTIKSKGQQIFKSKIIKDSQQLNAIIYETMIAFGQQIIEYQYDLIFSIHEHIISFQVFQQKLELILPLQDQRQWQNVLKKYLNQRGFHKTFKPIKKIGKGNFASVYLVQNIQTKIRYAVKSFSKESAYSQQNGKQCLIKEIQIMRQLNHQNIMKLQQVYESQNSLYIVFQLLQGGQLQDVIKNKNLKNCQIQFIIRNLLQGLNSMHKKSIMHRDLKPQNILLRDKDNLKCVIADFGLAQFQYQQTFLFARCGTPGYVAPQVLNIKDSNTKYKCICDLFSLGVIFHFLLFQQSIFNEKQYDQVVLANRACKFDLKNPKYQILPVNTLDLLQKLLKVDPNERITAQQALKHPYFNESTDQIKKQNVKKLPILKFTARKDRQTNKDSCLQLKMKKQTILIGKTQTIKQNQPTKVSLMKNMDMPQKTKVSKFTFARPKQ